MFLILSLGAVSLLLAFILTPLIRDSLGRYFLDHPDGDRQTEQVEGELGDRALAQAVGPGQDAEDGPQSWAERPGWDARRQGRTGGRAASGALQAVESILVHHGEDRRHFGDLVSDGFGVVAVEGIAAPATFGRLALDDLAELLGRDQGSGLTGMAGLPTPLLARGGSRGASLNRRGIGRGRL